MAKSNYKMYFKTPNVKIKKYFYVLRPLLAAQWIINNKSQPPMLFQDLIDSQLDIEMKPIVENLLILKKEKPEIHVIPKIQELNDYIEEKFVYIKNVLVNLEEDKTGDWNLLNKFFLESIENPF